MNKKRALYILMDILEGIECPQCRYYEKCWPNGSTDTEGKCVCLEAVKVLMEDIMEE